MGPGTLGMAIGGDLKSGYAMAGFSAIFITDAPWSYVPTSESLSEPCAQFRGDTTKPPEWNLATACVPKGTFQDGEEWELYGKFGYRIPGTRIFFLDMGVGVSHRKTADLYIFCTGPSSVDLGKDQCNKSEDFITWGEVTERYYPTGLVGLGISVRKDFLFNLDYHSRRGPILGMTWRF